MLAIIVPNIEELKTIDGFDLKTADNEKLKKIIGEVVNNVNSQMADYKRISSFEVQLDELEKTSTKKVKRFLYK